MLAYSVNRRRVAQRPSSPQTMLFVICVHIILLAVVMSAKSDLRGRLFDPPTRIIPVPIEPEPPILSPKAEPQPKRPLTIPIKTEVPVPPKPIDWPFEALPDPNAGREPAGTLTGGGGVATNPVPKPAPVASGPVMLTPPADLKPPYPASKLAAGEEATLNLRLTIDENGRVVAVEPIGRADAVFVNAARRHLIAHWRYKPAMQGGHPVASSVVITLSFMLDD